MSDREAIRRLEELLELQKRSFTRNQRPSLEERKANISKIPRMLLDN